MVKPDEKSYDIKLQFDDSVVSMHNHEGMTKAERKCCNRGKAGRPNRHIMHSTRVV